MLLVLFALPLSTTQITMAEQLEIIHAWQGKSRDNGPKSAAPANGMITDAESWSKLWKAWRPDEADAVPKIDFAVDLVLVAMVHGANTVSIRRAERKPDGSVDFAAMSTRMAGPGYGYSMIQVHRDGITSVQGNPVPGVAQNNDGKKGKGDARMPDEYVQVTMVGSIQTNVAAFGGETTGTTITAGDITWELDLQGDPGLERGMQKLHGQSAKVVGMLRHMRGVEIADRWIISVQSLEAIRQ